MGPILIGAASLIWASDNLARLPVISGYDPMTLVFMEHLVGAIVLVPVALIRYRSRLFKLSGRDWVDVAVIGFGGSALADAAFTAALQLPEPSVAILIQKLQPLLVVLLAGAFLREKARVNWFPWGWVAMLSAVVVGLPESPAQSLLSWSEAHGRAVILATVAMLTWGVSTIAGKDVLMRHTAGIATFWRWVLGTSALGVILLLRGVPLPWATLTDPRILPSLGYMGVFAGIFAMWLYYQGLRRTLASVTTFVELLYPLASVLISTLILGSPLGFIQIIAATLLFFSVLLIAIPRR